MLWAGEARPPKCTLWLRFAGLHPLWTECESVLHIPSTYATLILVIPKDVWSSSRWLKFHHIVQINYDQRPLFPIKRNIVFSYLPWLRSVDWFKGPFWGFPWIFPMKCMGFVWKSSPKTQSIALSLSAGRRGSLGSLRAGGTAAAGAHAAKTGVQQRGDMLWEWGEDCDLMRI